MILGMMDQVLRMVFLDDKKGSYIHVSVIKRLMRTRASTFEIKKNEVFTLSFDQTFT